MSVLYAFLTIGLVISFLGILTHKRVADFLSPKSNHPLNYLLVPLSLMWFTIGQLFCWIAFLFFALCLALLR